VLDYVTFYTVKLYCTPLPDKQLFFNLSSKNLNEYDQLFKRGLKHVLTPPDTTDEEIDTAMESFKHKVGWNFLFEQQGLIDQDYNSSFKVMAKPFHFSGVYNTPLVALQQTFDTLDEYKESKPANTSISHDTISAQKLKSDPTLFWTPSDKNLGLVCLNTLDYHQLVMKHLSNSIYASIGPIMDNKFFDKHYQRTKNQFMKLVNTIMIPHEKTNGNKQIVKYLVEQLKKTKENKFIYPSFHVLPKLHKGLKDLKSRPVVGAVDWFTTPVSKILSFHLQQTIKDQQAKHLLSRTTEAIQRLHNISTRDITDQSILVTMDIESLYTNIDLLILSQILEHIDPYLNKLCSFVNNHNMFEYLDQIYQQCSGIAMGTNAAPEMANIYLLTLLDTQISLIEQTKGYCRYLDDLFFIWNGTTNGLERFITKLQELVPGIRFSFKTSTKMVEFLDLCIVRDGTQIHHYTHQKLLNKYGYITPSSCHPLHVFKSWIKAELNRYKNNSSRRLYYQRTKELFYQRLLDRGYPRSFITPIFNNHYYVFPVSKETVKKKILPIILRYSQRKGLKSLPRLLHENNRLKQLLPQHKFFVCWKRSRSIQDIFCSSRLSEKQIALINTV
jgi:hypothetical protein